MMQNPLYRVDRSTLDLPKEQQCTRCLVTKPSDAFSLRSRGGAYKTGEEPTEREYRLHSECKKCRKEMRKQAKGVLFENIKNGKRLVSDRMIAYLSANNGIQLERLIHTLVESAISTGDADLLRLAVNTAQGGNPIIHVKNDDHKKDPKVAELPPSKVAPSKDLLSRVKIDVKSE